MLQRVRNKKGFTLIELMIVVAIVGILAAIAIPAYIDYTIRARISEVAAGYDALGTALSEYHASNGFFPRSTYPLASLASLPNTYGTYGWQAGGLGVTSDDTTYIITLGSNQSIASAVDGCTLTMNLLYTASTGYAKTWGTTNALGTRFIPRD
jgi:type IV pilus assembly protein PilA